MTKNKANKAQVHEVFQNISGKYDRLNNIISFEQHKVWRKSNERNECPSRDNCFGRLLWDC